MSQLTKLSNENNTNCYINDDALNEIHFKIICFNVTRDGFCLFICYLTNQDPLLVRGFFLNIYNFTFFLTFFVKLYRFVSDILPDL